MPKIKPPITIDGSGNTLLDEPKLSGAARRALTQFKPGYDRRRSGGRPEGARSKFATEYFVDLYEAWLQYGKAALATTAELYPNEFVRLAGSHMPREFHATIAKINISRLSNAELDALIEREIRSAPGEEEASEDPAFVQRMEP